MINVLTPTFQCGVRCSKILLMCLLQLYIPVLSYVPYCAPLYIPIQILAGYCNFNLTCTNIRSEYDAFIHTPLGPVMSYQVVVTSYTVKNGSSF